MSAETMQTQAYICPACADDHQPDRRCTPNDGGYDCATCGSRWGGYHSGTFCRLRKAGLPFNDAMLSKMALVADELAWPNRFRRYLSPPR